MDAKDLTSDDRSDREGVKDVDECFPRLDVCTPLALVIEPVHYYFVSRK